MRRNHVRQALFDANDRAHAVDGFEVRRRDHLGPRSLGMDPAIGQHDQPIGEARREREIATSAAIPCSLATWRTSVMVSS